MTANKIRSQRSKPPRAFWEADAIAFLEETVGTVPAKALAATFNRRAKRQGWALRTEEALLGKLKRLGLSRRATEDNWTVGELARVLNINFNRVRYWIRSAQIQSSKHGKWHSISRANLTTAATTRPELLKGIERDRLMYVLENEELVAAITALGPPTSGCPRAVKRLDTKEIYPSIEAAARACSLDPRAVSASCRLNKPAGGILFQVEAR